MSITFWYKLCGNEDLNEVAVRILIWKETELRSFIGRFCEQICFSPVLIMAKSAEQQSIINVLHSFETQVKLKRSQFMIEPDHHVRCLLCSRFCSLSSHTQHQFNHGYLPPEKHTTNKYQVSGKYSAHFKRLLFTYPASLPPPTASQL